MFVPSPKLKFAIKVSLSMMLAYIIPFSFGWTQASTAAITIMLIASGGGVSDGVSKGVIRVFGTIIGAVIGLFLIALFPQERILYLLSLSLVISVLTYLYYAYQGDSTVFMLSAMVIMMMFLNGAQNAFIYGMDRTFMTILGILIYTFVGLFLWPVKAKNETINDAPKGRSFVWFDPEYFKATIQLQFVFWFSVAFWIYFNPPAGFLVVTLATLIGLLTMFSPLKPSTLIILLSIGFIFSTLMYVGVLPNLVYGWELALFIFFYSFIAFYFLKPKISIFFLLGLFVLNISNEMQYNFDIFLLTLLTFYMFLIILMFFHNFPFSARGEHLFILMKERFCRHTEALIELKNMPHELTYFQRLSKTYHTQQLQNCTIKMQLWASKVEVQNSVAFAQECEKYLKEETNIQSCYNAMNKIDWDTLKVNKF